MIGIIDYGMGNLRSVQKAFEHAGIEAALVNDADSLQFYKGLVLPGVGAFTKAMENLRDSGMQSSLLTEIASGKPFLGICLGLQLLFEESEESFNGKVMPGLGVVSGRVCRFPQNLKVPQIGWNQLTTVKDSKLLTGIPQDTYVYFVHSYYVRPKNDNVILTTTDYGIDFVSSIARDNLFAIQFHPEKSSTIGLKILSNFGRIVNDFYQ